jgi:cytoskeletal protein CcmA (bactofilin family)
MMDTSTRTQDSLGISTISEDLTITGNVTSKGKLHLNGQVQGDLHCVALVLGENAQLEGNVVADDVVVRGRLIGSVRALRVTLESKSHVEANLLTRMAPRCGLGLLRPIGPRSLEGPAGGEAKSRTMHTSDGEQHT